MILFETIKPKLFEILTTEPAFSTGVYRDEWASCLKEKKKKKKIFENSPSKGDNFILQGKRGARVVVEQCVNGLHQGLGLCSLQNTLTGTRVPRAPSGARSQLPGARPGL